MTTTTRHDDTTLGPSTWILDAARSSFVFRVKHFWGLMTVQGHFTQSEGQAQVDAAGAISAQLRIDATSVDTKQRQRDKHLRAAEFFGVEQHPTISFATSQVTSLSAERLSVAGTLTVAGRSQALTFEASRTSTADAQIIAAEVPVDRTAFGITWSPLRMTSSTAQLVVTAHFKRQDA